MKYIEIAPTLSVRIEEIEAFQETPEGITEVYTHHNVYKSNLPYFDFILKLAKEEGPTQSERDLNTIARSQQVTEL